MKEVKVIITVTVPDDLSAEAVGESIFDTLCEFADEDIVVDSWDPSHLPVRRVLDVQDTHRVSAHPEPRVIDRHVAQELGTWDAHLESDYDDRNGDPGDAALRDQFAGELARARASSQAYTSPWPAAWD